MASSLKNRPIRLLQAISGSHQGGAEQFFIRLANSFNRAGIEQHIILRKTARGQKSSLTMISQSPSYPLDNL